MALQNAGHEVHLCQYIPHSNHELHVSTPNQFLSFLEEKTFDVLFFLQVEDVTLCTYIDDLVRETLEFQGIKTNKELRDQYKQKKEGDRI